MSRMPSIFRLFAWLALSTMIRGDDWPHFGAIHGYHLARGRGSHTFSGSRDASIGNIPLGGGYSGPSVVGGKVFVMDRLAKPYEPGKVQGNPNFIRVGDTRPGASHGFRCDHWGSSVGTSL